MVLAAVKDGPARNTQDEPTLDGPLRDDLLTLARRLRDTMTAADVGTALMLLQAGLEDPELWDAIEDAMGPTGARLPRAVIEGAVARGELPEGADPFAFEEVVGSTLLVRRANGLTLDDTYLASLVDAVVIPALVASSDHDHLPAGTFSGHPEPTHPTIPTTQETP